MNPFTFRTKPQGVWANFSFDCPRCRQEATVSHGRVDPHDCQPVRELPYLGDLESIIFPGPLAG